MRIVNRTSAIILGAALVLTLGTSSVHAGKPTVIPTWFDGQIEYIIPGVSGNVVGVDHQAIASKAANPIYVVAGQPVSHVLSTVPGLAGYNPYWDVITVTVNTDRDLTTDPFTSEDEILAAAANGEVTLNDTGFILLCQVVPQ
jgi:hypothetical protein